MLIKIQVSCVLGEINTDGMLSFMAEFVVQSHAFCAVFCDPWFVEGFDMLNRMFSIRLSNTNPNRNKGSQNTTQKA
jgi:hypothetical protein